MRRGARWLVYGGLAAGGAALLGRRAHRAGHHLLQHHNELFVGAGSRRYRLLAPWLVGGLYRAVAAEPLTRRPDGKIQFVRVQVTATGGDGGGLAVRSSGGQGSHQLGAMARADGLVVLPDGEGAAAGDPVDLLLLGEPPGAGAP